MEDSKEQYLLSFWQHDSSMLSVLSKVSILSTHGLCEFVHVNAHSLAVNNSSRALSDFQDGSRFYSVHMNYQESLSSN